MKPLTHCIWPNNIIGETGKHVHSEPLWSLLLGIHFLHYCVRALSVWCFLPCLYGYVGNLIVFLFTLNPSQLSLMCTGLKNNLAKYLRIVLLLLTTRPVVAKGASIPRVVLYSFPPCCIVFGFSVLQIFGEVRCLDAGSNPWFLEKPVPLSDGVAVALNIFRRLNLQ